MSDLSCFIVNALVFEILLFYSLFYVNGWIYNKRYLKLNFWLLIVTCVLFSGTGYISADYKGYAEAISWMKIYTFTQHMELPYSYFALWLDYSNFWFRIVLSALIFVLTGYILKKYTHKPDLALAIFMCIYLFTTATILRSSVADVIFYIGLFAIYTKRTAKSWFLFLILAPCSFFLHKTAFMMLVPAILSFIPFRKGFYKFVPWLLPVGIIVGNIVMSYIFETYFPDSIYVNDIADYSRSAVVSRAWSWVFMICLYPMILYSNRGLLANHKSAEFESRVYRYFYWVVMIWIVLVFLPGSHYIAARFVSHAFLPIVILLSYSVYKKRRVFKRYFVPLLAINCVFLQLSVYLIWTYFQHLIYADKYIVP